MFLTPFRTKPIALLVYKNTRFFTTTNKVSLSQFKEFFKLRLGDKNPIGFGTKKLGKIGKYQRECYFIINIKNSN
jgi:hypothetical protein